MCVSKSEKEAERMRERWVEELKCFSSFSDADIFKLKDKEKIKQRGVRKKQKIQKEGIKKK